MPNYVVGDLIDCIVNVTDTTNNASRLAKVTGRVVVVVNDAFSVVVKPGGYDIVVDGPLPWPDTEIPDFYWPHCRPEVEKTIHTTVCHVMGPAGSDIARERIAQLQAKFPNMAPFSCLVLCIEPPAPLFGQDSR